MNTVILMVTPQIQSSIAVVTTTEARAPLGGGGPSMPGDPGWLSGVLMELKCPDKHGFM